MTPNSIVWKMNVVVGFFGGFINCFFLLLFFLLLFLGGVGCEQQYYFEIHGIIIETL